MDNILVTQSGHIREVTINRAEKLNALNSKLIKDLSTELHKADEDKETRVVILTGAGEKAFVAGADISEFANYNEKEGRELSQKGQDLLFTAVEQMKTPVIAAVNGFALGGGLELAMSCHMRLASENARLGLPEVSLGVIPGYGGTQRLAQLVGKGKALEMITSAQMIDAQEAYRLGLVNKVVSQEELMDECRKLAGKIAANSPSAISLAIRSVNAQYSEGVNGYQVEVDSFGDCFKSEDFKEGTQAFLEKRKPVFKGE
ncbi:MAG TPA: enoyl-CoA hydratase-related protein [Cryomorphaceae bacterium]|nr:enoyl-CoA hydratase-related protein [Cryomorphaceae bacterium]